MKTVKKMVAVVLVSAMALSLAACGKKLKKISADDFKSKLEGEGFMVMESEGEDGVKQEMMAYSEGGVVITYSLYEKADEAKKAFDDMKDAAKEAKESGEIDSLSTSSNKLTAKSSDQYIVMINVDDMFIACMSSADSSSDADKALKALGF